MFLTWLGSWIAGRWLPLLVLAGCVAGLATAYGYGRSHANARWEARWEAAEGAARVVAAKQEAGWQARVSMAEKGLRDAQSSIEAYRESNGLLADRVRDLATRPRPVSQPAGLAQCVDELARERVWSAALGGAIAGSNSLALSLSAERDDAVARLWAAADAWPR